MKRSLFVLLAILATFAAAIAEPKLPWVVVGTIQPNDTLSVRISGWRNGRDWTRRIQVTSEGKITLPQLGELSVAGMSVTDLERECELRYAAIDWLSRDLPDPRVTITIKSRAYPPPRIIPVNPERSFSR